MLSLPQWTAAVRSLKDKTSQGVCGFHAAELKTLPEDSLLHLACIIASFESQGWPTFLMLARVALLPKQEIVSGTSQTRPITIMALIYRLWCRVFTSQVLFAWQSTLPGGITGCVPKRGAETAAYEMQWTIEACLSADQQLVGFSLDIIKCFNGLPRCPVGALLVSLGLPAELIHMWQLSIAKLRRCFHVRNSISPPMPSTTGIPEGDGVSVLGMLAVASLYLAMLQQTKVQATAFADNWGWSGGPECDHQLAMERHSRVGYMCQSETHRFLQARRTEITCLPHHGQFHDLRSAKQVGLTFRWLLPVLSTG